MRGLTGSKMVATRRGTRVEPRGEAETSTGEQTLEEVIPSGSPIKTRRSVKKDVQTSENSADEGKSVEIVRSPLKSDALKHTPQITTRSRHRSGQSDVSEAESNASNTSTRRSCRTQSLCQLTDSTRKLRSRPSVIAESILEDAQVSETESNCSSLSTSARRRQPRTASRSVSTRSRRQLLVPVTATDVSEEDSKPSSVSGVENTSRGHRSSPQKEEVSDAESYCSGISNLPLTRRSSRRNKSNVELETIGMNKDDADDQQTCPKINMKADVLAEDNVFFSPRRSSRKQSATQKPKVITSSNDVELESSQPVNQAVDEEKPEVIIISDDSFEEPVVEKTQVLEDNESEENAQESTNMDENLQLCLSIDSDDNLEHDDKDNMEVGEEEKNQVEAMPPKERQNVEEEGFLVKDSTPKVTSNKGNQEPEDHDEDKAGAKEEICEVEDEDSDEEEDNDDNEEVVETPKSRKASAKKIQNVSEDGLFVIDTTPGVDSARQFFLLEAEDSGGDDEDDDDDDEEDEEADEDDNDFINDDDDEKDDDDMEVEEEVVETPKSKKATKKQLQDFSADGLFVIDTTPGMDSNRKYFLEAEDHVTEKEDEEEPVEKADLPEPADEKEEADDEVVDEEEEEEFIDETDEEEEDKDASLLNTSRTKHILSSSIDTGIDIKKMGGLYISFGAEEPAPSTGFLSKMKKIKKKDELLQKSVITPDFEKKNKVPPYSESQYNLKKLRKKEREKTTGTGWFDMKAPQLTRELRNDLKALKMRSAMDPQRFYKKNDREGFPKYFQVGTVVDNPAEFYHSRLPKKQRKRTIVEELLADSEFRRYNKKKFTEIMAEKAARKKGKKHRKKNKFQK